MGLDTRCSATFNKQTSVGRVQLETDYVLFRGDFRVKLALAAITGLAIKDGVLSLKSAEGTLALALGPAADTVGRKDRIAEEPRREARRQARRTRVSRGRRRPRICRRADDRPAPTSSSRVRKQSDQIYVAIESSKDLARFKALLPSLNPDGAIWAIRRKGLADASEAATMAAGKAAGLVDVKVAGSRRRIPRRSSCGRWRRVSRSPTQSRRHEGAKARRQDRSG